MRKNYGRRRTDMAGRSTTSSLASLFVGCCWLLVVAAWLTDVIHNIRERTPIWFPADMSGLIGAIRGAGFWFGWWT